MSVAELIAWLQKQPQDYKINILTSRDGDYLGSIIEWKNLNIEDDSYVNSNRKTIELGNKG